MAVIQNDRDVALQTSPYRLTDTAVSVTSTAGAFNTLKNGGATLPSSITLTANVNSNNNNVFTAASVKTWHYALSTSPTTWVLLGTGNTRNITAASVLAIIGTAGSISYRCTVTENLINTAYDYYTVSYTKEASEPIVVDITRTAVVIPCGANGTPISYANTDTAISVYRGGVALTYNNAGGNNTFKVAIQADDVARTVGAVSNTSTVYTLAGITNITVDVASVVFIVTVYDASGAITSPTIGKKITYSKVTNGVIGEDGAPGADGSSYYLEISSPVITKTSSGAIAPGTHSQFTATGKRVMGVGLPEAFGFVTITANGNTEATTATPLTLPTSIGNSDGKTSYIARLYNQATVAGATLLDTQVIPVVFTGSSAISCVLTNASVSVPTDSAGSAGVYTGTGTAVYVYEGSTALAYGGTGTTAGTWTFSTTPSNITLGTITDSGTFATIGNAINIIADTASITYNVTGTTLAGVSFSTSNIQTFSRAKAGVPGTVGQSTALVYAYKRAASAPADNPGIVDYSFSTNTITTATLANSWNKTIPAGTDPLYVVVATASSTTTTDNIAAGEWTAPVLLVQNGINGSPGTNGLNVATVYLYARNSSTTVAPTLATTGSATYTYSGAVVGGTIPAGWTSAIPAEAGGTTIWIVQATASSTTTSDTIANTEWSAPRVLAQRGDQGVPGTTGTKSIVISAYKWGTSVGTYAQAATYNWTTGIDTYPAGWSASTTVGTNGQTLYQINLTITALATDTATAVNWSSATTNTVGYRSDGTIGPQGNSARTAYIVNTSATPPASPTALTGDVAPTGWSFTATSTLTAGQFMYQVDGILITNGNIAWGNPYLSNLKVGSLSALSADLGTVAISTTGSLYSTGKTYGGATGGFYQGYSGGAYKFDIGNSTNYLRWDGTAIIATGLSIRNAAGTEILSSGTVPADIRNSSVIDVIVNNSGGLLPNWSLNLADSVSKPAGLMAVEGILDRSGIAFGDGTNTWINISHPTDVSVSYGFPAIPIDDSIRYVVTVRHKTNSATPPATGLYLYFMEKSSALVSGKTHIGASPATGDATVCDPRTSTVYLHNNLAYPNNSGWVELTYTYTPTAGTKYASFCMANWTSATTIQYHVDSVSIHQDASLLGTTAAWGSVTSRPANVAALVGTEGINNNSITLSNTGALSGAGGGQIQTIPVFDRDRTIDRPPNWYPVGTTREFKASATFPGVTGDTYLTLETIIQYGDVTGGAAYQYAYCGTSTWRRTGVIAATSWSGSWVQDLDRNIYTGDLNATNGAPTGTLVAGTSAATVVTNASNGATAFTGTAAIRSNVAPTANAAFGTLSQVNTTDGNLVVTVPYTYTQGTNVADSILMYYREGGGTVVDADPCFITNAVSGSIKFTLKPSTTYTFGVQAIRKAEGGTYGTTILTSSSITTATANFTGNLNGTAASTVVTGAASGASALTAANSKLSKSGTDVLSGTVSIDATAGAGFKAGTLTWGANGVYTSGAGVAMTSAGITGHNGTNTTFAINSVTGAATFAGSVDIKSATSGARMEIKNNVIKVFDASGVKRVQLGDLTA